ncbi:MAG: hypothetical protein M3Y12_15980 [Bacteroidota bacterium]|nr:hypothetical protein [Bacteroidota bacterium]
MLAIIFVPLAFLLLNAFSLSVFSVVLRLYHWLWKPAAPVLVINYSLLKTSLAIQSGLLVLLIVLNWNRENVLALLTIVSFAVPLAMLFLAHRRSAT